MKLFCLHTEAEREEMGEPESYDFAEAMVHDGAIDMWGDEVTAPCRQVYLHPDSLHLLEPRLRCRRRVQHVQELGDGFVVIGLKAGVA